MVAEQTCGKIYAAIPAMKRCSRCGEDKPAEEMKRDTKYRDGLSCFCKKCHQHYTVTWQQKNKERLNAKRRERYSREKSRILAQQKATYSTAKARKYNRQRLYRVSQEWYDAQLEAQNGCCAICGRHYTEFSRPLAVDHDHSCCEATPTCGECNRGLLCGTCNTALHAIDSVPHWLQKALAYIGEANG